MEIYLIRHTKPLIGKDVCYGQSDVPVDITAFEKQADEILKQLPPTINAIYSSPLIRCIFLAQYIQEKKYPAQTILYDEKLKEVNFGNWENKKWDDINQTDLQIWMNNFVNEQPSGGESFVQLHERTRIFLTILKNSNYTSMVIITHAGVIRSIATHILQVQLKDAFAISCEYGSVTRLDF